MRCATPTLLICAALLTRINAASISSALQLVHVRTDTPRYIEFSFEASATFEPLSLEATSTTEANTEAHKIAFTLVEDENRKTFRNTLPQYFRENDVINCNLQYVQITKNGREKSEKRSSTFAYVIKYKPSDVLFFHTLQLEEGEGEGNTAITTDTPTRVNVDPVYQAELLETALIHGQFNTRLLLSGRKMPKTLNAVDAIREVIVEKLQLPQLRHNILQAKFIDDGLLFELDSARGVVEVLTRARLLLHSSSFKIGETKRDFIEISMLQRMAD